MNRNLKHNEPLPNNALFLIKDFFLRKRIPKFIIVQKQESFHFMEDR